jgi:pimeloyl-ACP methyl ester carboxylesterase
MSRFVRVRPNHSIPALAALLLLLCCSPSFAQDLKRRGSFGVQFAPVPEAVRTKLQLAEGRGILVQGVAPGGSAADAGIIADDIILKINETEIRDVTQFVELARGFRAGDSVRVALLRGGQQMDKSFALKPRPQETSPDFDILYKSVVTDGARRRVIITRPRLSGARPAILFITGIGCGSQDNMPPDSTLAELLYGLTRKGFVTMRVEKSGVGDSEGPPCMSPQVDLQAEVRGYVAGLKALKGYDFVDGGNVFLFGLSIGGVDAPLVAREVPVRGLIVAETVSKSWNEYELVNLRRQLLLRGRPYDEVERLVGRKEYCNHRLYVEGETPEQIAKDAPDCAQLPSQPPAPYTYMRQVAGLNLAQAWKAIDAPVLVIYGTSDFLTSLDEHQYLVDLINSFHKGRATLAAIDQMDHFMARAGTMRESMQRMGDEQARDEFQPALLERVRDWLDVILGQSLKG